MLIFVSVFLLARELFDFETAVQFVEQILLFAREALGYFDHDFDVQVAVVVCAEFLYAAAFETEYRARLRSLGYLQFLRIAQRGYEYRTTQSRLRDGERKFQLQVAAASAEELVRTHRNFHDERTAFAAVASAVAFACVSDGLSVVDTCGDVDRDFAHAFHSALTVAGLAGFGYDFALAFTNGACSRGSELSERSTLRLRDLSRAVAVGTGLECFAVLCTRAVAIRASLDASDADFLLYAERCLLESERKSDADIAPTLGCVCSRLL